MKKNIFEIGFNNLGFDEITWADNSRANPPNCIVSIPILDKDILKLSIFIFDKKIEVINEMPNYFSEWEEPFPMSNIEIYNNPYILQEYFSKSRLWSDSIIKFLSNTLKWNYSKSGYHLLKLESVSQLNKIFI